MSRVTTVEELKAKIESIRKAQKEFSTFTQEQVDLSLIHI